MDIVKYSDERLAALKEAYSQDVLSDQVWKEIKSQIYSGYALGMDKKYLDAFSVPEYDYKKRELIKYLCLFNPTDEEIIEIQNAFSRFDKDDKSLPIVVDQLRMKHQISCNLNMISSAVVSTIENYQKRLDKLKQEEVQVIDLANQINEKNLEIDRLNRKITEQQNDFNAQLEDMNKEIENKAKEIAKKMADKMNKAFIAKQEEKQVERQRLEEEITRKIVASYEGNSKSGLFKKKNKKCEKPIQKVKDFKIQKLPPGFNLSTYLLSSELSSSQMSVITAAVRLGVNTSIIKQMVDTGLPATQMKQVLEVIVTQMNGNNIPSETSVDAEVDWSDYEND